MDVLEIALFAFSPSLFARKREGGGGRGIGGREPIGRRQT